MIAGGLDLVDIEHVELEVAVELDHVDLDQGELDHVKLDHVELEVAGEVDHVGLIWKVIWMVNYVDVVIEVDFG